MVVKLLGGSNRKSTCTNICRKGNGFGEQDIIYPTYHWYGNLILGMIKPYDQNEQLFYQNVSSQSLYSSMWE